MQEIPVLKVRYVGYGEYEGNVDPIDERMLANLGSDGNPFDPFGHARELQEEEANRDALESQLRTGGVKN